jgi:hypothetical protein
MNPRTRIALLALGTVAVLAAVTAAGLLMARDDDDASQAATDSTSVPQVNAGPDAPGTGRGYLGLTVTLSAPGAGLRVASVESGGPADAAGLDVGDVLRAVDDEVVRTPDRLRNAVETKQPGDTVAVTYERGDRQRQATITLGAAPGEVEIEAPAGAPFANVILNRTRLGVRIEQVNEEVKARLNLGRDDGVVVSEVTPGSAAEAAGLQPGDIFLQVDNSLIDTIDELQRAVLSSEPNRPTRLRIWRAGVELTLEANLGGTLNLDNLGDIVPAQLRPRLLEHAQQGMLTPAQVQQVLRAYRARSDNVLAGTVAGATQNSLQLRTLSGEERSIALTPQTTLRRGREPLSSDRLETNELVLVVSNDGAETAIAVVAFGAAEP